MLRFTFDFHCERKPLGWVWIWGCAVPNDEDLRAVTSFFAFSIHDWDKLICYVDAFKSFNHISFLHMCSPLPRGGKLPKLSVQCAVRLKKITSRKAAFRNSHGWGKHQIRCHLAHVGHSVVCDGRYAAEDGLTVKASKSHRMFLVAAVGVFFSYKWV